MLKNTYLIFLYYYVEEIFSNLSETFLEFLGKFLGRLSCEFYAISTCEIITKMHFESSIERVL